MSQNYKTWVDSLLINASMFMRKALLNPPNPLLNVFYILGETNKLIVVANVL